MTFVRSNNFIMRGLRGMGEHLVNGSPVKPLLQLQIGLWLMTLHSAFRPQVFAQGSPHFWLIQALLAAHSELTTHSGLQAGGEPTKLGRHEQIPCSLFTLHWLFGPHGDGLHGSTGGFGASRAVYRNEPYLWRKKIERRKDNNNCLCRK